MEVGGSHEIQTEIWMCFLHNEWVTSIGQFWKWGLRLMKNQPFLVGVSNG